MHDKCGAPPAQAFPFSYLLKSEPSSVLSAPSGNVLRCCVVVHRALDCPNNHIVIRYILSSRCA
jgi:hypothetical protein